MTDLGRGYPTVDHHANGSFTIPVVLPYYSLLHDLNIHMLIALVVICTVELFVLTLILSR
jgi:hypothetical protein